MSNPQGSVTFSFVNPTDALVRMLMLGPLAANEENLRFFPRTDNDYYADFEDGERLRRIHEELPAGSAALTSFLFFDEINLDQKGYTTGDGIIIMGGFFTSKVLTSNRLCTNRAKKAKEPQSQNNKIKIKKMKKE